MDINEYQSYLRTEVSRNSVEDRTLSSTYLMNFLEKNFGLDKNVSISSVCDNKNDKGIDGIYVDDVEQVIHVFQSKFKENDNTTIGDKVLRDFSGIKAWFQDSETINSLLLSTINEELKRLVINNKLKEIIEDYDVEYHFVINALRDYNTNEYLAVNKDISLWDIEQQFQNYHYIKDDPLVIDSKEINGIDLKDIIQMDFEDGKKSIIFPVNAKILTELCGIKDYTLFNKNVRYGLGNTRVNKSIQKTLSDEKEKEYFFLYHNGISLVCENFGYDEEEKIVTITNYSIVNGAQSTLTFYNNQGLLNDKVKVLLRVIAVEEDYALTNSISTYNNNQNSISMKDLRANNVVQKRLTREFEDLRKNSSINIVYIPKKGKKVDEGCQELNSDYAAQLITACYLKEPYDTHLKTAMFDSSYYRVFNNKINAYNLIMFYNSHKILARKIEEGRINDSRIANYGLAQFSLLNVLFRILEQNSSTQQVISSPKNYIEDIESYNKLFNIIFITIIRIFNHYMDEFKKANSDFDYKNFFKSKEEVSKLTSNMLTMFETSLSLSGQTFDELCLTAGFDS